MPPCRTQKSFVLGLARALSWASSYELPAVLAAMDPVAGRLMDRFGGKPVLIASQSGAGSAAESALAARLPLLLKVFGASDDGQRQGWLMVPARIVQAGSPFVRHGGGAGGHGSCPRCWA